MKKARSIVLLLTISIAFMHCKKQSSHSTEDVDPSMASFENMRIHIFKHNCLSCHNTATTTGLVLEGADLYTNLLNVVPTNISAKNAGLKLVMPGSADSSFLYAKCEWNTTPFKYGGPMPSATLLSAEEVLFIKQWINAGAPKTGVVADYKLLHGH
ncbi:MAG: hypothetical protein RL660_2283 [Bacteroidota bacterium]|jgi:hypothetical protein